MYVSYQKNPRHPYADLTIQLCLVAEGFLGFFLLSLTQQGFFGAREIRTPKERNVIYDVLEGFLRTRLVQARKHKYLLSERGRDSKFDIWTFASI